MAKDLAIVLNNGSVNSAVVTAMAAQRFRPIMVMVEGSIEVTSSRPRTAFDQQVTHFKPYRSYVIPLSFPTTPAPHANASMADPRQSAPLEPKLLELLSLMSLGVRFAAHHQAAAIYFGTRVGPTTDELAQATEYFQIWSELVQLPCGQAELELQTPLLELDAWQVIDVGYQVGAPLERTWSCEEDSPEPCLSCRGCRDREAAFQQAGKPDPTRVVRKL